jgi:hypothetical protein
MIAGIDYSPKKRPSKVKIMLWLLVPAVIFVAVYYFYNVKILEKPQEKLIVIKAPEREKTKVAAIPVNIETSEYESQTIAPELLENLDEVIQIFQEQL